MIAYVKAFFWGPPDKCAVAAEAMTSAEPRGNQAIDHWTPNRSAPPLPGSGDEAVLKAPRRRKKRGAVATCAAVVSRPAAAASVAGSACAAGASEPVSAQQAVPFSFGSAVADLDMKGWQPVLSRREKQARRPLIRLDETARSPLLRADQSADVSGACIMGGSPCQALTQSPPLRAAPLAAPNLRASSTPLQSAAPQAPPARLLPSLPVPARTGIAGACVHIEALRGRVGETEALMSLLRGHLKSEKNRLALLLYTDAQFFDLKGIDITMQDRRYAAVEAASVLGAAQHLFLGDRALQPAAANPSIWLAERGKRAAAALHDFDEAVVLSSLVRSCMVNGGSPQLTDLTCGLAGTCLLGAAVFLVRARAVNATLLQAVTAELQLRGDKCLAFDFLTKHAHHPKVMALRSLLAAGNFKSFSADFDQARRQSQAAAEGARRRAVASCPTAPICPVEWPSLGAKPK